MDQAIHIPSRPARLSKKAKYSHSSLDICGISVPPSINTAGASLIRAAGVLSSASPCAAKQDYLR
ncbi:MAG TPA: hypothetical protein VF354_05250 [Candidatus Methanoperedens sp.]